VIYAFAEYELDTSLLELRRNGQRCPMEPQVFDVLAHLVEHRDRVVRRQELLDHVWPEGFVSDSALSSRIMAARKAIGDSGETQQLIRTVHRRGFRFVGQVAERSILALNAFPGTETASPGAAPVYDSGAKQAPIRAGPLVVGRNAELAKLRTWVTEAFSGHPRTVLVSADAGLGKTTLLDLLLRDLTENSEALIGRGQCIEQHGIGEPYMPVLGALDEICRGPRGRGRVAMLARHAPTWLAQLPWLLDDTEMEPLRERLVGTTRERMLREMAEALRVIGERTPLLLVLEDLHWSDPSTVDLISFLARGARSARVALLGTYRPSGVGSFGHPLLPTVREMRARGLCEEITLNPLSEPEVRMLAAARLGTPEADPEVGRLLHRRTGGNPLFVVNVLEHWLGQELVSSEGPTRPIEDLARTVPGDLRGMIEEQFRQFAREDRSLLEACAVAGREFSAAAVAAAVGTALDQTEARCEALSQRSQQRRMAGRNNLRAIRVYARSLRGSSLRDDPGWNEGRAPPRDRHPAGGCLPRASAIQGG
jgi:DNA-binding winged helix-turn-helix (wHTH) protein